LCELGLQGGFRFELEEAAALGGCGVGRIESEQRARRAASRNQEITAAKAQSLRVLACRLLRQAVAGAVGPRESNGREFPVRSRIQFDRQPPAFGINHVLHPNEYRPRGDGWRMRKADFFRSPVSRLACSVTSVHFSPLSRVPRNHARTKIALA